MMESRNAIHLHILVHGKASHENHFAFFMLMAEFPRLYAAIILLIIILWIRYVVYVPDMSSTQAESYRSNGRYAREVYTAPYASVKV